MNNDDATLARNLNSAFLISAAKLPNADWRVRYREVNRAAGVFVGWALGRTPAEVREMADLIRHELEGADPFGAAIFNAFEKRVGEIAGALATGTPCERGL